MIEELKARSVSAMYRIKINNRLADYKMQFEHSARLVYGECVQLAVNGKLPIYQRPQEIILYLESSGELTEIEKWTCEPKRDAKLGERGIPFPRKELT